MTRHLGSIIFIPASYFLFLSWSQLYGCYILYTTSDQAENATLLAFMISEFLLSQFLYMIFLMPFVVFAWLVALRKRSKSGLYVKIIRISGWLLVLTIPFVSVLGVLVLWLTKRHHSNE